MLLWKPTASVPVAAGSVSPASVSRGSAADRGPRAARAAISPGAPLGVPSGASVSVFLPNVQPRGAPLARHRADGFATLDYAKLLAGLVSLALSLPRAGACIIGVPAKKAVQGLPSATCTPGRDERSDAGRLERK